MQYELMDSGLGMKLEKWGKIVVSRPDPQAVWKKGLSEDVWQSAHAYFGLHNGKLSWKINVDTEKEWQVSIDDLTFQISLSVFKHLGVFPEHRENWQWMRNIVSGKKLKVLNLFGYTGGATLALAKGGAEVVHVDASKPSLSQARENAKINSLSDGKIRWILDDVKKFVKREISRGVFYDGVVMDPPAFGRGAKGEVWKIEKDLLPLLQDVKKILKPDFKFILVNGYASLYTASSYAQLLDSVFGFGIKNIEYGNLSIKEKSQRNFTLPAGIFARYSNK